MKKLFLVACFSLFASQSFSQDDVYNKQQSAKMADLKKSMELDYDKFEDKTRVKHKPMLGINSDFRLNCEFVIIKDKPVDLIFKVNYYGREWLFVNKLTFLIDEKKYSYDVTPFRVVEGSLIIEKASMPVDGIVKDVVNALLNSKKVELRYTGKDYFKDAKQLSIDIKRLRRVVEYYKLLGGVL